MSEHMEQELTLEDHRKAFTEVAFLLDIFAATIDDLMGGATVSIGRIAGRHMAKKLPIYAPDPTLETALQALAENLSKGFEISFQCIGNDAEMQFGRCAIRDVCNARGQAPGGPICLLFHAYMDGIVNEIFYRPTKSKLIDCNATCIAHLETR